MNVLYNAVIFFSEFNFGSIILRLFVATLFGGIIGLDRGLKRRPAGIRTFSLVCVGAAIAMITNEYLYNKYGVGDVSRMSAQVISGVGFLGAGTIIVTGRQRVKGLTTAASLWATASMGIAIGAGFFLGAIVGFVCIMFAMIILHNIDEKLSRNSKVLELYVEVSMDNTVPKLLKYIHSNGFSISSFEKQDNTIKENNVLLLIELNLRRKIPHSEVVSQIALIEGVFYVEEIK